MSSSPALVVAQSNKTDKAFVKQPLAHTYSIVARDPETGQLGVAAQSHWFSVGAIVVVTGKPTGKPWADRLFDLRVEDHPEPVAELKRLVKLQRAYTRMNTGDELFSKNDIAGAVREYGAAEALTPDNIEMVFWHAVTLANANKVEEALPLFKRVFAADSAWATLVPRLPKSKLLPDDQKIIQRILSAAPAPRR